MSRTVEALSPNHWTTREFPNLSVASCSHLSKKDKTSAYLLDSYEESELVHVRHSEPTGPLTVVHVLIYK